MKKIAVLTTALLSACLATSVCAAENFSVTPLIKGLEKSPE